MNHHPGKDPSAMVALFGNIPLHTGYFTIRPIRMKGRKVEMPTPPIRSVIHCFVFITEGEALITIGEESYYFKPGECAAIPAGQAFAVRYFDNCTGYMGGFNTEYLNNSDGKNIIQSYSILRRWGAHKVQFDHTQVKYIESLFESLYAENTGRNNKSIIKSYLTILLTEIEEISSQAGESDNIIRTENTVCNKFIELVFESASHATPLTEYASKLNISKDYLHKTVKQHTGKTPLAWITEAVILQAKVLLSNTDLSINEIAFKVGINDPSYFSRLFRKHTGITPQEYRKIQKS